MNTSSITSVSVNTVATHVAVSTISNPVAITLGTGTDLTQSSQYYAIITMSAPTLTTYLDFTITFPISYSIRYYAKDVLDAESFYTSTVEPTTSLNLDRIAQILNANPQLSSLYTITKISNTEVKVTANNPGSGYNLDGVLTVSTGLTVTYGSFTNDEVTPAEGQKITDLYMWVTPQYAFNNTGDMYTTPNTSKFLSIDQLLKPYNFTNQIQFDLAPALNSILSKRNPTNRPSAIWKNNIVLIGNEDNIHWRASYGVQYSRGTSNIPVQQTFGYITGKKAWNMALPISDFNNTADYTFNSPIKFRENQTSPKLKRDEYHILHFPVKSSYISLEARYFVTFKDGTSTATVGSYSTYETATSISSPLLENYAYMFQVNELVAEQEALANKIAIAFGVVICYNGTNIPYTEERRYQIDNKVYEFPTPIIFQNSLGGYNSFVLTGRSENRSNIDRQFYVDTNTINYKNGDKFEATYSVSYKPTYVFTTGAIDKKQYTDLKEVEKSRNIYALVPYDNISYTYNYTSCDLLQAAFSGTVWTTVSGTSAACHRQLILTASPTTSRKLSVYDGYFPSGEQAFQEINNFTIRVGRIKATLQNGATTAGKLWIVFSNNNVVQKTEYQNITTSYQFYDFSYHENMACDEIEIYIEAINFGDDQVLYEFMAYEGFEITPLEVEYKYLKLTVSDYKDTDGDDLKEVNFTFEDTISETSL